MGLREDVEAVLHGLQPGEVVSYGEVAEQAGWPGRARAVGAYLRAAEETGLPWWRVVAASGHLVSPAADEQARRLRAEGVTVIDGRIPISRSRRR